MTHVLEVANRGWIFGLAAAFALVPAQAVAAFALRLGGTDVGEVWVLRGRFGSSAVALVAAYCALLVVPQALPEIRAHGHIRQDKVGTATQELGTKRSERPAHRSAQRPAQSAKQVASAPGHSVSQFALQAAQ